MMDHNDVFYKFILLQKMITQIIKKEKNDFHNFLIYCTIILNSLSHHGWAAYKS